MAYNTIKSIKGTMLFQTSLSRRCDITCIDIESEYIWDHFDAERFEGVDLIISCGDLKSEYLSYLATMIHVPVFYVHGNHDTGYIDNPPGGCDSIEDKLVEFNGFRILGLGGSKKYSYHDRYSVPPFQYTENKWKKNKKIKISALYEKGFDILSPMCPLWNQ